MSTQLYGTNTVAAAAAILLDASAPKSDLPASLASLVGRLGGAEGAELVRHCFSTLLRLLSDLQSMSAGAAADEVNHDPSLVSAACDGAFALIEHVEEGSARCTDLEPGVEEALVGVGFALRHEVRRAVEFDLAGLEGDGRSAADQGKVAHAYNVLCNCFQQCVVLLARAVDPAFDAGRLFDDAGSRLEQSVRLRDALVSLILTVKAADGGRYPQSSLSVIDEVELFRRDHLRNLMRRDWETFDGFVNEVVSAREQKEFSSAAKRFLAYLETLLAHVQMRAVLKEQPPARRPARASAHAEARTALGLLSRAARRPAAWAAATATLALTCGLVFSSRLNAEGGTAALPAAAAVAAPQVPAPQVPAPAAPAARTNPAPAAARPGAAEGNLTIQVAAYRDLDAANSAAAALASKGFDARVSKGSADGQGIVFRVQVGRFGARAEASRVGDRLRAQGAARAYMIAEAN